MSKIEWTDLIWDKIPDFPEYFASVGGHIKSTKQGKCKILKHIISRDGHHYVFLYKNGKQYKTWVHRAILNSFIGLCMAGHEARHLDGNPHNNKLNNLLWGTRLENMKDRKIHGTQQRGEYHASAKLTEKNVVEIKSRISHISTRKLGREYGVSHTTIRRAALGIKWSYLSE